MKVTVDIVIFTIQSEELKVLLVKRGIPPFKGQFALPGGFVHQDESLDDAGMRELREETGVSDVYLEQLYSFGDPGRDPRERIITVAYYALISADRSRLAAGTDTTEAAWWRVNKLPPLAFDHRKILDYGLERLRNKLEYTTAILAKKLDKRNFRRKIELLNILRPTSEYRRGGQRPARLYRFGAARFEKLKDKGILFPF